MTYVTSTVEANIETQETIAVPLASVTYTEGAVDDVKVNGTSVVEDKVASVTVPTKTSDLTNDSGFLTEHQSLSAYRTSANQDIIDATKQDVLTAGRNITIANNVISASGESYTAGSNIQISNNVISATDTTYTAGTNITIDSNNVISASGEVAVAWGNISGSLSNQIDLQSALSAKSTVSVSATGTSTTEVKYITVNNTEYKLGSNLTYEEVATPTITWNLTGCAVESGSTLPSTVEEGSSVSTKVLVNAGYALPMTCTGTGATISCFSYYGNITVSNPTGNVVVNVSYPSITGVKYRFNDTIALPSGDLGTSMHFIDEAGNNCTYISPRSDGINYAIGNYSGTTTQVYDGTSWLDEDYRTITVYADLSELWEDFTTWFLANATAVTE